MLFNFNDKNVADETTINYYSKGPLGQANKLTRNMPFSELYVNMFVITDFVLKFNVSVFVSFPYDEKRTVVKLNMSVILIITSYVLYRETRKVTKTRNAK